MTFLSSRPLLLALMASGALAQTSGRYHYASIGVRTGVEFAVQVHAGAAELKPSPGGAAFAFKHPALPELALEAVSTAVRDVVAAVPSAATASPGLLVAVRAPEPAATVALAPGEWSAALVNLNKGKAAGLITGFADFKVGPDGALSGVTLASHQSDWDDLTRLENIEPAPVAAWRAGGEGTLVLGGITWKLRVAASGDVLVGTSETGLLIGLRRDRDATTGTLSGLYRVAEFGARNSYAFAPEQARFFAGLGELDALNGQARVTQRLLTADRTLLFQGQSAYVLTGGAGSLAPRLEQRRRNLALVESGRLLISAQMSEVGGLTLVHGLGVGLRALEPAVPSLAARGMSQGGELVLYGRGLLAQSLQLIVDGQPAPIARQAPNQVNLKVQPSGSSVRVELEWMGKRGAPVTVALSGAPDFADAPAAPGSAVAMPASANAGQTITLTVAGPAAPAGFAVLFDGIAGVLPSATKPSAAWPGALDLQVTVPTALRASSHVAVAIAAPGFYTDLGDIAVARPRPASAN
ncbi:MAG: hypothetical protein FJW31_29690 [Acidobacteria bacterium]|nr:hypothetical protein [Acidobacteriota bacterium]